MDWNASREQEEQETRVFRRPYMLTKHTTKGKCYSTFEPRRRKHVLVGTAPQVSRYKLAQSQGEIENMSIVLF